MKIKKFVSLKDETIITNENVQILGERIAVYAVQSAKQFAYGSLNNLYKGLIRDINYNLTLTQHFTDGYDIAQEAICFLCNFIGHKLGEVCVPNIHKGIDSIKLGCYKHLYNYLRKQKKHIQTEENIERYIYKDLSEYQNNYNPNYKKLFDILNSLDLTDQEKLIAIYISDGVPLVRIAEFLNVCVKTIQRRKTQIKQKYMQIYG